MKKSFKKKKGVYNEITYEKFMNSLKQQQLNYNNIYYLYKWKYAIIILGIFAFVYLLIGIYIYIESNNVIEVTIDYNNNDTKKTFTIPKSMKKPIHIYYKISNYYSNFKGFLTDQSSTFNSEYKCEYIKTYEDVYNYRCINNVQTLPELNNVTFMRNRLNILNKQPKDVCDVDKIEEQYKNKLVFPCGLSSASIFNDIIELSLKQKIFTIDTLSVVNHFDFFSYVQKKKNQYDDYILWINTNSSQYRNWSRAPMSNSFLKPYGIINEDLDEDDDYTLTFIQNLWPSEEWKAKKSIIFVSLTSIGNSCFELAYLFFALCIFYVIVIIIILLLVKFNYCKLGKTFGYCMTSNSSFQDKYMKNIKKKDEKSIISNENNENINENENEKTNEDINDNIYENEILNNINEIEKLKCLCPLH